MNECKIRYSTIEIVMLCISFYEFTGVPHSIFLAVKYFAIAYLLLAHCKECKKMPEIVFAIMIYGGITFIATLAYQDALNRYVAAFIYMLHILTIYVTIVSFIQLRGVDALIKCLTKVLFVFAFMTDILMLFINYNFSSPSENYLIGNKFAVSYLHCFIIALLFWGYNERKQLIFRIARMIFWLFSIIICMRVTCTTGILICMFMGAMTYLSIPLKIKEMISFPKVVIGITAVMNVLVLGSSSLLTNPYIASFISDVLGKSYTWIGRLHIYAMIFDVIKVHPWIGYGYFSNIIEEILGFGNAQNGVLKIIVDSGIIGLIGYTLLVNNSLKKRENISTKRWSMIVFIYCMIIASIAEINLTDYLFFLTTAIVYSVGKNAVDMDDKKYKMERGKSGKIIRKKCGFKWI